MGAGENTVLTERQVEILELREEGHTQREVAEKLGTTDSNVSAIEQAAESNIDKARRTVSFVRTLRTPVQFTVPAGTPYDEFIDAIYEQGDEADIKITYCGPELYGHLFRQLEAHVGHGELNTAVRVGLTDEGDVNVFPLVTSQ